MSEQARLTPPETPVPKVTYREQLGADRIPVDAECPVCQTEMEVGIPKGRLGETFQMIAHRGRVLFFTCDRHSLADVHRLDHPWVPQRKRSGR